MHIEDFLLERYQSIYENQVDYNLTESGIHPYSMAELLTAEEMDGLCHTRLGYGQTNGQEELRLAISRLYNQAAPENVLVTNGSAEANFITLWSLLQPGDELVLMLPNYMQIWGIARSFGVKIKPFYLKEELGWAPDLEELGRLITPQTKMIALCDPNNPTGAVLSEDDHRSILRMARSAGAWLYVDEVYRGAELNGVERPSFWDPEEKVLVCAGLSKAYALPGLRIGWLVGPPSFAEKVWAAHDYTSITAGILSNRIAALALQPQRRRSILDRSRSFLTENLKVFSEWVDSHGKLFHFVPPRAGGMAFLRYDLDVNSTLLAEKIRREKSVLVIAGDCFGMDHYLRLGIGAEKDYLLAGLERLDQVLAEIKKE
jgi:aspartate/methionine/tyrosine aminotransferase